ncbi:MAG: UDP-N-acetylmuramate dehydrogenase [Magnetococcales bacterium]|nr:UDP-N-acetylmuramate dehydrogenase [Magnetococcales bacterium]
MANPFANLVARGRLLTDVPLAPRTTWRIGGAARWFLSPASPEEVTGLLARWPPEIPRLVLGGGSNLLVADAGWPGAVLDLTYGMQRIYTLNDPSGQEETVIVHADAGASTSALAHFARLHGLSGAEFLGGIPGTIGGALRMNAGAHGGEIRGILIEAELLDETGQHHCLAVERLGMGYRRCGAPDGWLFLAGRFRLRRGDPEAIRATMRGFNQRRRASQPLELPSAGSVFKNPPEGPRAWELIARAGMRGATCGDAQVAVKHGNFFVNRGQATADDMLTLIRRVQDAVERDSSIRLELEIKLAGHQERM